MYDFIIKENNLNIYFSKKINLNEYRKETSAYIVNVFSDPIKNLSKHSITIYYANAVANYRFDMFQNLGDWLLFTRTMFPEFLNGASIEYYDSVAQCSYYRCYKILDKKWILYEELADSFPNIIKKLQILIS